MSVDNKKMDVILKPKGDGVLSRLRKTLSTVESTTPRNGVSSARPSAPLRFLSCPPDSDASPTSPGEEPCRWRAAIGGPLSPHGKGEQIELNLFKKDQDVCHMYDPVDLDRLAWCDYCAGHIWGLGSKACHRCRYCHLTCHLHCCDLVNVPCIVPTIEAKSAQDQPGSISDPSHSQPEEEPAAAPNDDTADSEDSQAAVVVMRRGPHPRWPPPGTPLPRFSLLQGTVSSSSSCSMTTAQLAYDFSSLDRDSIKHFHISVDEEESSTPTTTTTPCQDGKPTFQDIVEWPQTREKLVKQLTIFNENDQGLFLKLMDATEECVGSLRVHINLIRPIKMLLTTRPPSIYDVIGAEEDNTEVGMSVLGMTSFRLPRGTTKLLHISSCTTAQRVISSLLRKFRINDNPHKFALYEHTIEGDKEVRVRKLGDTERPLHLLLSWAAEGVDPLNRTLGVKRIVLQENETGDIQWSAFSLPELNNFMTILAREEAEYRSEITLKFDLKRQEIVRLLSNETTTTPLASPLPDDE